MKKTTVSLLGCMSLLVALAASAWATTYKWPSTRRPALELTRAIEIATRFLDKEHDYYCLRAVLSADSDAAQSKGAWTLVFGEATGIEKGLAVTADGSISVIAERPSWSQLPKADKCKDLEDAATRLAAFFASRGMEAERSTKDNSIQFTFKTRDYQVHQRNADGGFALDTVPVRAPDIDGFVVLISLVHADKAAPSSRQQEAYWLATRSFFLTQVDGVELELDGSWGLSLDHNIPDLVEFALGERAGLW